MARAGTGAEICPGLRVDVGAGFRPRRHLVVRPLLVAVELRRGLPVATVDRALPCVVVNILPLLALVPRTARIAIALGGVEVLVREFREAGLLPGREVRLDRIECLPGGFFCCPRFKVACIPAPSSRGGIAEHRG